MFISNFCISDFCIDSNFADFCLDFIVLIKSQNVSYNTHIYIDTCMNVSLW